MEFSFPSKPITTIQFDLILEAIRNNIYGILEVTRKNIQVEKEKISKGLGYQPNNNTILVCAGLFTYAIEEYGKYKLLEQCRTKDSTIDLVPIRNKFFNHDEKFQIAKDNLPEECFIIYDKSDEDALWSDIILDIPYPMGWVNNIEADFATRLDLFNVGIKNDGNVKSSPEINFEDLDNAVEKFYNEFLSLES